MRLPARAWRPRAPSRRGRRCRRALCRPPRGRGSGRARGRTPRRSRPPCGKPCPLPPAPLLRAPRRRSCRSPNASEAALASLARRHNATLATSGAEAAKNAPHPCFSNTSHFNPRSPCGERPQYIALIVFCCQYADQRRAIGPEKQAARTSKRPNAVRTSPVTLGSLMFAPQTTAPRIPRLHTSVSRPRALSSFDTCCPDNRIASCPSQDR